MEPNEPNWCAGLHITRSRPLTVSELGRIRSRRRWLIARALLSLVGIPVVLILFVAATAIPAAPEDSFISIGAVILIALGIFLGIPLCIAVANDYFKRAGALKRQSLSSKVLVCEGVVGDVVAKPSDLRRIVRLIGDDSGGRSGSAEGVGARLGNQWTTSRVLDRRAEGPHRQHSRAGTARRAVRENRYKLKTGRFASTSGSCRKRSAWSFRTICRAAFS